MHTLLSSGKSLVAVAIFAGLGSLCGLPAQVVFTQIPGMRTPFDIANDGPVLVGSSNSGASALVRYTTATGPVFLGTVEGDAMGISSDGSVVVGAALSPSRQIQPFTWTQADGITGLPPLNGASESRAYGVSGDGTTAVGYSSNIPTKWVGLTPQALPFLSVTRPQAVASAISTDGSTIVGYATDSANVDHAVRWTASGLFDLGKLGGFNSLATGVSADGTFIIGYGVPSLNAPNVTGFIWSEAGGKTDLKLPGRSVVPRAVSADGSLVIGYTQRGGNPLEGFAWTPDSGMRDFRSVLDFDFGLKGQLSDWSGLYPWTMTDDGRYWAGSGFHDGVLEAWLLDRGLNPPTIGEQPLSPVPEPSTYGLAASALLLGLTFWRRRREI